MHSAMRQNIKKPIVLIGMMGSGKSTIGKRLAYKLNLQFYDSDKIIEEREGLSIVDIYDFRGEEYFKNKEAEVIKEILGYGSVIISTGGESFLNEDIRNQILDNATSIWLKTNVDTLHERVSRRNTRPQFAGNTNLATIEKMVADTYPIYEKADITIESKDMEAHFVVDTILSKLRNYNQ
jgi:shikimate kinase